MHSLDDYIYELPESAIGQELASPPDSCKFLVYDTSTKEASHHIFREIDTILPPESLLIFNTSKVVKARLYLPSLKGEIFFLRAHDEFTFDALIRPGKKFQVGDVITLDDTEITFTVVEMTENGRRLQCSEPILDVLEEHGHMPLPPYIAYSEDKSGAYQPLQAKQPGSVAAPTASLHFTEELLAKLRSQRMQTDETVLHIGLGTFKQVDVDDIKSYDIHAEEIEVTWKLFERIAQQKIHEKSVIAVGTTVTRTLETMPYIWCLHHSEIQKHLSSEAAQRWEALTKDISSETAHGYVHESKLTENGFRGETKLYLYPGKLTYILDGLITNFHLPKSSLLMLVATLMGYDEMMKVYQEAIKHNYKFYSFGDAMYIQL